MLFFFSFCVLYNDGARWMYIFDWTVFLTFHRRKFFHSLKITDMTASWQLTTPQNVAHFLFQSQHDLIGTITWKLRRRRMIPMMKISMWKCASFPHLHTDSPKWVVSLFFPSHSLINVVQNGSDEKSPDQCMLKKSGKLWPALSLP